MALTRQEGSGRDGWRPPEAGQIVWWLIIAAYAVFMLATIYMIFMEFVA